MSRSSFYSKFKKSIGVLKESVEGTVNLDVEYPKVYRKIYKHYQDSGVQLYNNIEDDYEIILNCVEEDLIVSGVFA